MESCSLLTCQSLPPRYGKQKEACKKLCCFCPDSKEMVEAASSRGGEFTAEPSYCVRSGGVRQQQQILGNSLFRERAAGRTYPWDREE